VKQKNRAGLDKFKIAASFQPSATRKINSSSTKSLQILLSNDENGLTEDSLNRYPVMEWFSNIGHETPLG